MITVTNCGHRKCGTLADGYRYVCRLCIDDRRGVNRNSTQAALSRADTVGNDTIECCGSNKIGRPEERRRGAVYNRPILVIPLIGIGISIRPHTSEESGIARTDAHVGRLRDNGRRSDAREIRSHRGIT